MVNSEQIDLLHVMQKVESCRSQKELAQSVGFSVGKVNYVLKSLMEKGLIKAENFVKSDNKRAYRYFLTPKGLKEKIDLTQKYIAIKKREYEILEKILQEDMQRQEGGKIYEI